MELPGGSERLVQRNQFILFVKDTQNKRLRSYILDLPE